MTSKLTEFKNAVIARNVVARVLEATEFDSPEALKKYLHDHPGADKSNHSVKKEEKGEGGKEDKKKSKAHLKEVHDSLRTSGAIDKLKKTFRETGGDFELQESSIAGGKGGHLGLVSGKTKEKVDLDYTLSDGEIEITMKYSGKDGKPYTQKLKKPYKNDRDLASHVSDAAEDLMAKIPEEKVESKGEKDRDY